MRVSTRPGYHRCSSASSSRRSGRDAPRQRRACRARRSRLPFESSMPRPSRPRRHPGRARRTADRGADRRDVERVEQRPGHSPRTSGAAPAALLTRDGAAARERLDRGQAEALAQRRERADVRRAEPAGRPRRLRPRPRASRQLAMPSDPARATISSRSGPSPTSASAAPGCSRRSSAKASSRRSGFLTSTRLPSWQTRGPVASQPSAAAATSRSPGWKRARSTPAEMTCSREPSGPVSASSRSAESLRTRTRLPRRRRDRGERRRASARVRLGVRDIAAVRDEHVRNAGERGDRRAMLPVGTRKCARITCGRQARVPPSARAPSPA